MKKNWFLWFLGPSSIKIALVSKIHSPASSHHQPGLPFSLWMVRRTWPFRVMPTLCCPRIGAPLKIFRWGRPYHQKLKRFQWDFLEYTPYLETISFQTWNDWHLPRRMSSYFWFAYLLIACRWVVRIQSKLWCASASFPSGFTPWLPMPWCWGVTSLNISGTCWRGRVESMCSWVVPVGSHWVLPGTASRAGRCWVPPLDLAIWRAAALMTRWAQVFWAMAGCLLLEDVWKTWRHV